MRALPSALRGCEPYISLSTKRAGLHLLAADGLDDRPGHLVRRRRGAVDAAPFQIGHVEDCNARAFPVTARHGLVRGHAPHRQHLPVPGQVAGMAVAGRVAAVDSLPREGRDGQDVHVVVGLAGSLPAVEVDVVAGIVLRGRGDEAEIRPWRGNLARGSLHEPRRVPAVVSDGGDVEEIDLVKGHLSPRRLTGDL